MTENEPDALDARLRAQFPGFSEPITPTPTPEEAALAERLGDIPGFGKPVRRRPSRPKITTRTRRRS